MSADNWSICVKCGQDFREDYEIGISDNHQDFYVSYQGECEKCGYQFQFKHTQVLP